MSTYFVANVGLFNHKWLKDGQPNGDLHWGQGHTLVNNGLPAAASPSIVLPPFGRKKTQLIHQLKIAYVVCAIFSRTEAVCVFCSHGVARSAPEMDF